MPDRNGRMDKRVMKINHKSMLEYFNNFDSFSHKYFKYNKAGVDLDVLADAVRLFDDGSHRGANLQDVSEIFQTMNKVYNYGSSDGFSDMNLLEQATDKFLKQYVDIDGLQELFRPLFFNFEWMMHLEYVQKKRDYSYYRDHYMHQIRNMYEMFKLLDEKGMWQDCMEIYKKRKNTVANHMAENVAKQQRVLSEEYTKVLEKSFGNVEEWCYHYIIFSTTIVSSLVHDIGYPIIYIKRNLSTIQDFLPQSSIFMGMEDGIPKIKSLLSGSLLFETVDNSEIIRRLNSDDHGTYSAIILLCNYYDNGKIFSLEPAKRMIIELSALVIYNHTLRHHFQDEKNYDRYQNVFTDNPISYLFRLCDDMQEWDRVYFEITGKGNFFICDKCKQPIFRHENEKNCNGTNEKIQSYGYEYVCLNCGNKAINTVQFPYRRMMNVAPFTEIELEEYGMGETVSGNNGTDEQGPGQNEKKVRRREEQKWVLELKCNNGKLLQLARYNSNFAIQRANGIRELRGLVCGQMKFPRIFVKAFVSNNPIAIKVKILNEFIQRNNELQTQIISKCKLSSLNCGDYHEMIEDVMLCYGDELNNAKIHDYSEKTFSAEYSGMVKEIKSRIEEYFISETIYDYFKEKCGDLWNLDESGAADIKKMLMQSINFYLFLLIFCDIICRIEFISENMGNIDDGKVKKKREKYELALNSIFTEYASEIAKDWGITDSDMIVLIADCITCMYGNMSEKDFFGKKSTFRNNLRIPLRADIKEMLKKYTREPDEIMKKNQVYDFWSDYYFFHMMDYMNELRRG